MPRFIGIDLGAETLKIVELSGNRGQWMPGRRLLLEHHKRPTACLGEQLRQMDWEHLDGAAVAGRLGRQVALLRVPLQQALARGVRFVHGTEPLTVVSIGSRGFSTLELRAPDREIFRENGRCAQGTGNFLRQLVARFGLEVEEAARLAEGVADPATLSGRCPVILKTDLTHLANLGESRERILAGLLDAICDNVQALVRPGACPPRLLMAGGVARSTRVREHFRRFCGRHGLTFLDAPDGLFLEALGAALLAAECGAGTLPLDALFEPAPAAGVETLPALALALERVRIMPAPAPDLPAAGDVLVGFDIGSTGAKAVALAGEETAWEGYVSTDGAPVRAAQALLREFLAGPAAGRRIRGFGVTGSGREIVGSLLATCYGPEAVWILNEIAAHAAGALAVDARVDTIFEIGGQDAKYIRLEGGRVVDAAMNEACSAGTGSFIEEQGRRFRGIRDVGHLGRTALAADGCAALGQHCSIFMTEAMDAAVAAGVPQERIIAGIYHSVVANYLNRVKGSRSVGRVVFCQGMPFAAPALAAAVAAQTGADVIVPPRPGLMGALGIALLASRELPWQDLPALDGTRFMEAEVEAKDQFPCPSTRCGGTGNKCRIERLATRMGKERRTFTWGGACALWDRGVRRSRLPDRAPDPFRERRERLAGLTAVLQAPRGLPRVALAEAFQLHGLFPFFATFIHSLGFDLALPGGTDRAALRRGAGAARVPFCAPMQHYHGLVAELADGAPDYLFLPMIRDLPRVDGEPHSVLCPIAQGAPDILRLDLGGPRILSPVVDLGPGNLESPAFLASCRQLAQELGAGSWRDALEAGRTAQAAFDAQLLDSGRRALDFCRDHGLPAVAVLGRSYTLHNDVLNANVPAILREQGAMAIPQDCLPLGPETPVFAETYWGHSQRALRAAWHARRTPDLYPLFCSNYSCGPDSLTVPMVSWLMEGKPFTVIETDGHAGDAGTRTRVEAFLHCVKEARSSPSGQPPVAAGRLQVGALRFDQIGTDIVLIPSMGPQSLAAEAVLRGCGLRAEALPPVDPADLAEGRRHTSGKECLPMTLTLGSLLRRVAREPCERFLFLMPGACGPCRFGAYRSLEQLVLDRLGLRPRVRVWSPPWADFFQGLPAGAAALVFTGIAAIDTLQDALTHIRPAERIPGQTERIHRRWLARLLAELRRAAAGDLSAAQVLLEVASGRAFGFPALLGRALRAMARADSGRPLPRVLVTGEVYVRLEAFAGGDLARQLNDRGLRVTVATCCEVMLYADHGAARAGLPAHLEGWVKRRLQHLCRREACAALRLPAQPPVPELLDCAAPYMRAALDGDTVLSLGLALHAWRRGRIDAAVLTGPLECMPDKLAEAQFTHVAEREGLATLALSMDGGPIDPAVLDNFAFEVRQRVSTAPAGPRPPCG